LVVGADPKLGRGVVSTCNYLARSYGIKSGQPISEAYRRCPQAVFLPVDSELYQQVSEKIFKVIKKYSKVWEQVSLDEAYLDLSFLKSYKKAEILAQKLKQEIFKKEKLTSTIGIGPNKLIAKIASQKKKPNGLLAITPRGVENFLLPLDIEDLPGIGPKTAEVLRNLKINKIKDLKKVSEKKMVDLFGKWGQILWQRARGIDPEPVTSEEIIKSIGKEHTFLKDTRDSKLIFSVYDQLIEEVFGEIKEKKFKFKTVTAILRYFDFETHQKSKTIKDSSQDFGILKKLAKNLLLKLMIEKPKLIRLVGLRVKIEQKL